VIEAIGTTCANTLLHIMDRNIGAFGPVRFPVFPPSGCEDPSPTGSEVARPILERVEGFHAAARPPVVFLTEHSAACSAGKFVVIFNTSSGEQSFIGGHTDAVTCLAYSADQGLGASGQLKSSDAVHAEVLLWDVQTLQPCSTFRFHHTDIEALGFAQRGEILISISADRDHTLALWAAARDGYLHYRKRESTPLAVCSAYKSAAVNGVLAAPEREDLPPQFVTYGAGHIKFWHSDRLNPKPEGRRGMFGTGGTPRAIVSVAFTAAGDLVAGGIDGEVLFFEGTRATRRLHVQDFSVVFVLPLRDAVLVAYSHGIISLINAERSADIDVAKVPGAPDSRMRSSIVGGAAWRSSWLLLATQTHLLCLNLLGGLDQIQSCRILLAQSCRPITSLCAHPHDAVVFAGSLDGTVRCYEAEGCRHVPDRSMKASGSVTCLAMSGATQEGSAWIAVGCDDSTVSVIVDKSKQYILRRCLSSTRAKLTCAAFSRVDSSNVHPLWLAVGSENGGIHVFRFKDTCCRDGAHTGSETVTKIATLRGHSKPVVSVSFADTLPCGFLMSVDAAGQALAFDVPLERRLPSLALVRDVSFSPWTAPVGWPVLGCWSPMRAVEPPELPQRRFFEIKRRSCIAVSDPNSLEVELFPFPCPVHPSHASTCLRGPAAPISALLYSQICDCLIAASDTILFRWTWANNPSSVAPAYDDSPLRPLQRNVLCQTPQGPKRALAAENVALLSPESVSPGRVRFPLSKDNSAGTRYLEKRHEFTPPVRSSRRESGDYEHTTPERMEPVSEMYTDSFVPVHKQSEFHDFGARTAAQERRRSLGLVSPKIGSYPHDAPTSHTAGIRKDARERARSVGSIANGRGQRRWRI